MPTCIRRRSDMGPRVSALLSPFCLFSAGVSPSCVGTIAVGVVAVLVAFHGGSLRSLLRLKIFFSLSCRRSTRASTSPEHVFFKMHGGVGKAVAPCGASACSSSVFVAFDLVTWNGCDGIDSTSFGSGQSRPTIWVEISRTLRQRPRPHPRPLKTLWDGRRQGHSRCFGTLVPTSLPVAPLVRYVVGRERTSPGTAFAPCLVHRHFTVEVGSAVCMASFSVDYRSVLTSVVCRNQSLFLRYKPYKQVGCRVGFKGPSVALFCRLEERDSPLPSLVFFE